jgi:hypothetical protein
VPSALATLNLHAHGHKKGSHVESTVDSSTATAAKVPPATVQNLFNSLLQSLEQVVTGVSAPASAATTTVAASPASPASPAASVPSAAAQPGGAAGSTQSSSSLVQNYLSQLTKLAGSNVSAKA